MLPEFQNEPFTDFSVDANRNAFRAALARVEKRLPMRGRNVIGGKTAPASKHFESLNPSDFQHVIGRFPEGTIADAARAVDVATKAFASWSRVPAAERSALVLRIGAILRRRKHEFSAMMVLEESKSWPEADGDTAEAIDFCEFYAREMERLAAPQPMTPYPGERNELEHIPLGVCVVIPPWNFPLAILCGMTTAALVAGNTVVLKPSSDAAGIASMFFDACEEAGVPDGVLNFLTGGGSTAGNALVENPKTRLIAFTGSREVGVQVSEKAGRVVPGQIWIKRAILEMGGKDFILVDETADIEDAANGIVSAAFGFQGQKCSACSRLIVHQKVHGDLLDRVVAKTEALSVGDVRDPKHSVGAVINAKAQRKILEYVGHREEGGPRRRRRNRRAEAGLLRDADGRGRHQAFRAPGVRGDLRSGALRPEGEELRRGRRRREHERVRPDGSAVLARARATPARQARALRRQPVPEPQVHGRPGGRAPVRRVQHVRHGLEGRRTRLPQSLHAAEGNLGETVGDAPRRQTRRRTAMFGYLGHPLVWLIVTVLDVIAIVSIVKSSADSGTKILWALLVIFLPLVGMILYFLMGPGRRSVV